MKVYTFIERSTKKDIKCCSNCKHFSLWGCYFGTCVLTGKEKAQTQRCKKIETKKAAN